MSVNLRQTLMHEEDLAARSSVVVVVVVAERTWTCNVKCIWGI